VVIEPIARTVSAESEFLCLREKLNASCRCVDHYFVFAQIGRWNDEWQNRQKTEKRGRTLNNAGTLCTVKTVNRPPIRKKIPDAAICVAPDVLSGTNTWTYCLAVSICSPLLQRISAVLKYAATA